MMKMTQITPKLTVVSPTSEGRNARKEPERLEEIDRIAYEWITGGDTVRAAKALALKREIAKRIKERPNG